jgi:hypothetical protein
MKLAHRRPGRRPRPGPSRPSWAAWPSLSTVLAIVLAGCLDVPVPSVAPTVPPTPEPTPVTKTYQPNATAWYEGLVIHVDTIDATLDQRGGPVGVHLRFENPGEDEAELDARVLLQADATSRDAPIAPTRESKLPSIPAGGTAEAVLTYELQGLASIDNGVVLIGEAPLHVARVPLTAAGGAADLFEPVTLALSGFNLAGDLKITLRQGALRWDLPDWSQELGANAAVLTLTYDVTYAGTFGGGFAFTGHNVALRLPDGSWVDARPDGHSQSIELIGAGKTKKGLSSRFEIPSGVTGRYALVVRNGTTHRLIAFDLKY